MDGRRIEDIELADIHRVLAPGFREPDAAAKADLAAVRIFPHHAAGGGNNDLETPARAEQRRACGERRAYKIDLADNGGAALINVQRRAGDGDAVVALK